MKKWQRLLHSSVSSLLLAASSLVPTHARACDRFDRAHADSTCVTGAEWQGRSGTWFHESMVPELLYRLRQYPNLETQVTKYRLIDEHREQEMASLRVAIERYKQSNTYLQQEVELRTTEARRAREELAKGRPWYTSPLFWGIVMFVAGAAVQHACCGPGK